MAKSHQAQVAALCKSYVIGLGIKCSAKSESFAGGTAVRVEFEDQPPEVHEAITTELKQYQYGQFDGMTDCYNYTNSRDDIPQTRYLSVNNYYSAELKQRAWDFIRAHYNTEGLAATYSEIGSNDRVRDMWVSDFMYRFLNASIDTEESAEFWATEKPKAKAKKPAAHKAAELATVEGVTVTEGTKVGYVEIRFPEKPEDAAREELKAAGFRWSRYNGCWWGKESSLPATYQ